MSGLRRGYRKDDVWIRLCQLFKGESGQLPVRNRQDRGCLFKGSRQVKELLLRGKTDVIKGFVAKTGMKFDAPLKLTPEGADRI